MSTFREIQPENWQDSVFKRIGTDWMLAGAATDTGMNMMTASWGGMGILWHKPVVYMFLRPQRYTRELVDSADTFSLTFYPDSYREQLNLCGSRSGRDIDKIASCGFDILYEQDTPYPAQADIAIICKKLYRQPLDPQGFIDTSIDGTFYPDKDYHILYVGEIKKLLVKE